MIYEIMNNEEFAMKDTSFIVDLDLADEFVADLYDYEFENMFSEYDEQEVEDMLNGNDIFICSRVCCSDGARYFLEPLRNCNGAQFFIESDAVLIEEDLLDCVDFDRIEGEMFCFNVEDDIDFDVDEIIKELELEDSVGSYDEGFKDGYKKAMEDVSDFCTSGT